MTHGKERIDWISAALGDADVTALICTLPENVLMLSGYWPVVGTAIAVATSDGRVAILAPNDEHDLAQHGWATEVRTFAPGSLQSLDGPAETVVGPLGDLLADLGVAEGRLGFEDGEVFEGATYAAMHLYGVSISDVLQRAAPNASMVAGWGPIQTLRSVLTADEVERVRLGCQIAGSVFTSVASEIRPGRSEAEIAAALEGLMTIRGLTHPGVDRASAYVWCMSGPNSALAGAAYARSRARELREGDFVLIHCNSTIDGYWTDITRTFHLGEPDERGSAMYDAALAARAAALSVIRPGARASDVDAASRAVLTERGFGEYFTHGLGHNVGFSVISAEFPPRIHPASPDRLAVGMTFNVEPSIYIEGYGGLRHCDVVTVHEDGPEVLTPFQADVESLILRA